MKWQVHKLAWRTFQNEERNERAMCIYKTADFSMKREFKSVLLKNKAKGIALWVWDIQQICAMIQPNLGKIIRH